MTSAKDSLFTNGYFVIPNFIDSKKAKELAIEFKDYCITNNIGNDSQAPNSMAYYNYKSFLEILCDKTSEINLGMGEPVLPSYVYSRVYKNGSVLEPHVDRPACEISITVHLDGDTTWPIWIETPNGENRSVMLYSGDAMVYLGCERTHWREEYSGEWYAQMFLHYVRSNGSNFEHYFDKINSNTKSNDTKLIAQNNQDSHITFEKKENNLELIKEKQQIEEKLEELKILNLMHKLKKVDKEHLDNLEIQSKENATNEVLEKKSESESQENVETEEKIKTPTLIVSPPSVESFILTIDDLVPQSLCNDILNEYKNTSEWASATVGFNAGENKKVRNCDVIAMSNQNIILKNESVRKNLDNSLYEYVKKAIQTYNEKYEHCIISQDSGYDLLRYETGGFYSQHTDSFTDLPRAVSCSICLNEDYIGGEFAFFDRQMMMRLPTGGAVLFPSNFMFPHEVMPVISGTRYSIVTWFI